MDRFIGETKGAMETMQFRGVENSKIRCATKLFNELSTKGVRYAAVSNYQQLLTAMRRD
jgi:type III restriction enzyme